MVFEVGEAERCRFRALTLLEVNNIPVGMTDDLEKIEGVACNFGVYNEDEEEVTDG